jgi:aldehyde:ferredoxin oxidoreductase
MLNEPVSGGPSEGFTVKLTPMLEEYYAFRGWDKYGVPKPEKLKELSLEFTIEVAHD